MLCTTLVITAFAGAIVLDKPFVVKAGDKPLTFEIGHTAPILADYDGDGLNDLLVGQFGSGHLKIFRNKGTASEPQFGGFELFKAGGKVAQADAG